MKGLILPKKTGFKNTSTKIPIIIRDFRGKLFYSTVGLRPVKSFNLPEGNYFVESGNFSELSRPVSYNLIPLPNPERKFEDPEKYTITFDINPNKCTINWSIKTITFDLKLLHLTIPELFFILYHEYGHTLYKTEKYADGYSCNKMLQKGFNPSQVGKCQLTSLSSHQKERKDYIVNNIINHTYRI